MTRGDIVIGDVVQLAPGPDTFFGGCFMTVTEVKGWGAQGFILIPEGPRGVLPKVAFYRAKWDEMTFIGHSEWILETVATKTE